eukprot:COSAG02_NODE_1176_length_14061_cov_96.089529_9_plen_52_part_00
MSRDSSATSEATKAEKARDKMRRENWAVFIPCIRHATRSRVAIPFCKNGIV